MLLLLTLAFVIRKFIVRSTRMLCLGSLFLV